MSKPKFVYYRTRAQYEADLLLTGNNAIIDNNCIIFIEDTKDIITHGSEFATPVPSVVTITSTEVSLQMEPNTIYRCTNPISSLTITGIPNSSIYESTIEFVPSYGSNAQMDRLCPIVLPNGVNLINFSEEEYTYNKKAIISVRFGLTVFGQQH